MKKLVAGKSSRLITRSYLPLSLIIYLFLGAFIWSRHAFCAQSHQLDQIIEAAKKEGSVTLGITLREKSHGRPTGELYLAAFKKHYPFLKVNFKRVGAARERERVIVEMASGISDLDVATVSDTMLSTMIDAKMPRIIEWEKYGVPKYFIHPKNVGLSTRTSVYGIAYNRNLIPDEVAKTFTWETCTDQKWMGKTAANNRPRHLIRLYHEDQWGRQKTLDYAKRWAANKPFFEASQSTSAEKLTSGAYHMICGLPRRQVEDIRVNTGANSVAMVFPEPVPVDMPALFYVPVTAKHPNAAILFLVWTTTSEAQNIQDDTDFTGHPSVEGTDINKVLKGKKVAYATWTDFDKSDDYLADILKAMGMPVVR